MPTGISGLYKNTKGAKIARGEKIKQTHFDRIKTYNVEEMAEFIFLNFQTDRFGNPIVDNEVMPYESNVIEWLESEVQEDEM
jgi:hypothetical protein